MLDKPPRTCTLAGVITHVKLFALSNDTFAKLRKQKYWRYRLPSDEWDDIQSKAAIRVFAKRGLWKARKGALAPWVYRVVDNAIKNGLRDHLGTPWLNCTPQRRRVLVQQVPLSAAAHVIDEGESHRPEWYIDDMVGECANRLRANERPVFERVLMGDTPTEIGQSCGIGYQLALKRFNSIKRTFRSSLSMPS